MAIMSERIDFPGSQGQLAARLDRPQSTPKAYALFAHCFTCTKDIFAARRIAARLAELGIGVLRFDFTGLGGSEGDFANSNFSSNVEDLVQAARHMHAQDMPISLLIGHSLGGAAVLQAAAACDDVKAVATIGAPFGPAHLEHHFKGHIEEIENNGEAQVTLVGRPFRIRKQFLQDIRNHKIEQAVADLKRPLLVMHAPLDATVGIDNASAIFLAAKHPKSFVSLDNADHLLSREEDAVYAANVLAAWAGRYLGVRDIKRPTTKLRAAEGETLVVEDGLGKFTQYVETSGHWLTADEPISSGGDDTGPSPYDFLLTGLGACTSMTLRMYAAHKKLPVERIAVRLAHQKIHADDCADCETKQGKLDEITREIEITGDVDEATRIRMLEIADKCPVHRTLTSEIKIRTRLSER